VKELNQGDWYRELFKELLSMLYAICVLLPDVLSHHYIYVGLVGLGLVSWEKLYLHSEK
jgi:hypothetical protein